MSEAQHRKVKDELGREIELRVLDPSDMLDLLEAAGPASSNAGWVRYASVVASVSAIDGVPIPIPTDKRAIKALAKRLQNEGIAAVAGFLYGDDGGAEQQGNIEELAKN